MKQLYLFKNRSFVTFILLLFFVSASAQFRQSITWVNTSLNADNTIDGFYLSLPATYNNAGDKTKYPLIIYLHGDESVENGRTAILENGIPKLIKEGGFPETFQAEGKSHSFIVVAPHYTKKSPIETELNEAIDYILERYRVNTARIYLTGMSRGGGNTWEYAGRRSENAEKLAAIVPVAGASAPNEEKAAVIAEANLPVWATHNDEDPLVTVENTNEYVKFINSRNPQIRAKKTIFQSKEHEGWTTTYDPNFKEGGKNVYEWMLQYRRGTEEPIPVMLTTYEAAQTGANEITISWSTENNVQKDSFYLERSASEATDFSRIATVAGTANSKTYTFIDKTPLKGKNYYRLSHARAGGGSTLFSVLSVTLDIATPLPPDPVPLPVAVLVLKPNPILTQATLQINNTEKGPVLLTVISTLGRVVKQWTIQKDRDSWEQTVPFYQLLPGSYVLQVQGKTFRQSIQIIKR
jgi:dienelactone hydrolase